MTDHDDRRADWIKESAAYIKEKQRRDDWMTGRDLDSEQGLTLRDEMKSRLEDAERKADALLQDMIRLRRETVLGRAGIVFGEIQARIHAAHKHTVAAKGEIRRALRECVPAPRTREKVAHRSAVRLAVGYDAGPNARSMALEIMEKAGLEPPSHAALTAWLKEAREE
ncbi:hypothetical protein [Guyparkeria sp.]|uniref:hypothetical protein n=1 Tax=Guyparkeria sp. TaxID=2035736 RepID=UPI00397090A4